jgi:hypothetical protein
VFPLYGKERAKLGVKNRKNLEMRGRVKGDKEVSKGVQNDQKGMKNDQENSRKQFSVSRVFCHSDFAQYISSRCASLLPASPQPFLKKKTPT